MQQLYLELRLHIDPVVVLRGLAIDVCCRFWLIMMTGAAIDIRLDMLHLIIQAAMGWTNSHQWLIHARGSTWGVPDPAFPDDTLPANRTFLLDMVADIGVNRFAYIYDFGDHWSHTIKIVKPMPAVPGIAYPLCRDC